ncbi:MAG TPA: sterol desaturase family protein, partial [Phnomibacter sp.]|nr:sterol desaturase family protein [Phnomibacter sp.]
KGWVAWTLVEYCMHRWAFHKDSKDEKKDKKQNNHDHHDKHPQDINITGIHLALGSMIIFAGIYSLFQGPLLITYFAGFFSGGAVYMLMHWLLHQHYTSSLFPLLVKQHIWHHCKYPDKCYGVTTLFWDKTFKTLPLEFRTLPEKIIRFYYHHEGLDDDKIFQLERRINRTKKAEVQRVPDYANSLFRH